MKGPKLPKWMWVKGKSKNFYSRLKQEGIPFGVTPWLGQMYKTPYDILAEKLKKELN